MCVWMKMALLATVDICVCHALHTVLYMGANSHTEYSSQAQIVLLATDSGVLIACTFKNKNNTPKKLHHLIILHAQFATLMGCFFANAVPDP